MPAVLYTGDFRKRMLALKAFSRVPKVASFLLFYEIKEAQESWDSGELSRIRILKLLHQLLSNTSQQIYFDSASSDNLAVARNRRLPADDDDVTASKSLNCKVRRR